MLFRSIFPFCFRFDEATGKYVLESGSAAHKIACVVIQSLILYECVAKSVTYYTKSSGNVGADLSVQWVMGLEAVASPVFLGIYTYKYWKSGPHFARILELLQEMENGAGNGPLFSKSKSKIRSKSVVSNSAG